MRVTIYNAPTRWKVYVDGKFFNYYHDIDTVTSIVERKFPNAEVTWA